MNKLTSGILWMLLFLVLLVIACTITMLHMSNLHIKGLQSASQLDILVTIMGGFSAIVVTIFVSLIFAGIVYIIGRFFRTKLPYNTYLRIVIINILIRLVLNSLPMPGGFLGQSVIELFASMHLSIAIWAAVPIERRKLSMLLVGLLPGLVFLSILFPHSPIS